MIVRIKLKPARNRLQTSLLISLLVLPIITQADQQGGAASAYNWLHNSLMGNWSRDNLPTGVSFHATNWSRLSEWRYFDPATAGGDPDYGYVSNRLRFGVKVRQDKWAAEASLQYVKQAGLPDDAAGTPGGALGLGAVYFGHNSKSPSSIYIKYLNFTLLDIADAGISLTAGRMDYSGGMEKASGVNKIDWLKKVRLDARLLGGFGWSIYQRSFDGLRFEWDHELGYLSVAAFRPTQGGFESDANKHISQIDVLATSYSFKPGKIIPYSELQLFHYYFADQRKIAARIDNSGLASPAGRQDIAFHNLGGHIAGAKSVGSGIVDWLVWGVYQTGDWFEQKHEASGLALEAGYQFMQTRWQPWIRIGAYYGSGDDDPTDNNHGTFYQMLPTVRKYAFTTTYNLMNNEDYFIQLFLKPHPKISLRTDIHRLALSESADSWYQGAGATQARGTVQGFGGRPSGGATDLGTSIEFTAKYQLTKVIGLHAFYGHVFGGDVVKNNFTDNEDFDFFFLELTLKL